MTSYILNIVTHYFPSTEPTLTRRSFPKQSLVLIVLIRISLLLVLPSFSIQKPLEPTTTTTTTTTPKRRDNDDRFTSFLRNHITTPAPSGSNSLLRHRCIRECHRREWDRLCRRSCFRYHSFCSLARHHKGRVSGCGCRFYWFTAWLDGYGHRHGHGHRP